MKMSHSQISSTRSCKAIRVGVVAACLLFVVPTAVNGQSYEPDSVEFFEAKIRPVLVRECYGCHSNQTGQAKGGLKLDTRQGVMLGGDSGTSLVPGDLDESPLWSAINYEDYAMPPNKQLPADVIEDFRLWIEAGAPDPRIPDATDVAISSTVTDKDIEQGKQFWSFKPPRPVEIPDPGDIDWTRGNIDAFVLNSLEQNDMQPADDADAHTVLRRLCFDLIGLPPTPEQIDDFVTDWESDPDAAVATTVDRLLNDKGFGERWGRHWLDVARYAESTGKELNATYPYAWRYRDYVIDSFNEDKPYDRFVQEQIAGDLLPVRSDDQWTENLVATGFLAMGPKSLNETNPRQFRADLIDEQIDVSTRVVLGISVACARCHDHKFDPIPQSDYYALAGVFGNTETYYGTLDTRQNRRPSDLILMPTEDEVSAVDALSNDERAALQKRIDDLKKERRELTQQRSNVRKSNNDSRRDLARQLRRLSSQMSTVQMVLDSFEQDGTPKSFCMGVQPTERSSDANLLVRGEVDQPAAKVARGYVQVIGGSKPKIDADSGGRLELARWMTDEKNPLAARVMVNRIWQHLIGQGLVKTTENFGATGLPPTHPELLDYLALQFVKNDWSIKEVVREIATSRAYRMSSKYNSDYYQRDPDNKFVWRASPRRLEAEAIRDAMLSLSGRIDLQRPHASDVARAGTTIARNGAIRSARDTARRLMQRNDDEGMGGRRRGNRRNRNADRASTPSTDPVAMYRSVYLPVVRDNYPRSLSVFDFAESSMVVGNRETSNTPDQGLYLLNNATVIEFSKQFAARLMKAAPDTESQIKLAFLHAFGRPATDSELRAANDFLDEIETSEKGRKRRLEKMTYLCQSIMAAAEFRIVN